MSSSADYWRRREEAQRARNITDEREYAREISRIYESMLDSIEEQINSFYAKYASAEGISMAEARKRAASLDIERYARKAERYVSERDFSAKANEEMRLYNLTMKVNRLELLKANIGLELVSGHDELERFMEEKIGDATEDELRRQAGILGKTVINNAKTAHAIVNASFHNATFSDRIWMHQELLRNDINSLIQVGLIQGKNPRVLARELRRKFKVKKSDAERLMRTELSRARTDAQMREYDENGFGEYKYIACGGADVCEVCKKLDGKVFSVKKIMPGVNAPPMHPNCHCSTGPYIDEKKYYEWLDTYDQHQMSYNDWVESYDNRKKNKDVISQIELLKKYGTVEKLMLTGTNDDLKEWANLAKNTGKNESQLRDEMKKDTKNWEFLMKSQSKRDVEVLTKQLHSVASEEELNALRMWTGSSYGLINSYERYGREIDDITKNAAKTIEKVLDKTEITKDMIVKRGTGTKRIFEHMPEGWQDDLSLLKGQTFEDKGFTATSPFIDGAFSGSGANNATIYIDIPKGTHGAYLGSITHVPTEKELLLQKGYSYRIIDAEYIQNEYFNEENDLIVYVKLVKK